MARYPGGRQRGEPGGVRGRGDVGVPPERRPEVLHAQHGPRHRGQLLCMDWCLRPPLASRLLRHELLALLIGGMIDSSVIISGHDFDPYWGLIFAGGFDGAVS